MASINGLTVKSLKTFYGHEGESCAQGNLYLGTKKIASWSQDAKGGIMDWVSMEEGFSEKKLRNAIIARNKDKEETGTSCNGNDFTVQYDLENLMCDLLYLKDCEKEFKKVVKTGYQGLVKISNDCWGISVYVKQDVLDLPEEKLKERFSDQIEELKKKGCRKGQEPYLEVFRSLEDFCIGEKIELNEIRI